MAKSSIIDVSFVGNGDIKVFLTSTDELGASILKRIASGEYVISTVSSNQQMLTKLPPNSIVIEKASKPNASIEDVE